MTPSEKQRKLFTQGQRHEYVKRWKESKLSRSDYCRREGLCLQTFCYWVNTLDVNKQKAQKAKLPFVALSSNAMPIAPSSSSRIEIILPNGVRCHFVNGVCVSEMLLVIKGLLHDTHD